MNGKILLAVILMLAAIPLLAADVSGKWNVDVTLDMGSGTPTFDLKQEGEKLTGAFSGVLGNSPLTGTVKGDKIEFQFEVSYEGTPFSVSYSGTIEDDGTMKGECAYSTQASGTWTAKRAE